jgi:Putative MetA-pathway of phenol degradation
MRSRGDERRWIGLLLALLLPTSLRAQEPPIQVNPNRPTFATPALTTQVGVAELEIGLQRSAARDAERLSFTPFLVKVGLRKDLELRVGGNGFLRQTQPPTPAASGIGDTTLGAQWCYLRNGPLGVDEAVQLTLKLPTASAPKGLGSGETDETLMLLLSRDLGPFHADANLMATRLGRPEAEGGGAVLQPAATLSVSRTLDEQWSLTGEVYWIGATSENPRVVSNLWAIGYKVSPRLVLDAGLDVGLSHGAQKLSLFTGLTVGMFRVRPPPAQ